MVLRRLVARSALVLGDVARKPRVDGLGEHASALLARQIRRLAYLGLGDEEARAYLATMYPLLDADELLEAYRSFKNNGEQR